MSVRVKVCGLTRASDAEGIEDAWALGILLHNYSPRSVSLKAAQAIREAVNPGVLLCGVFCDQPLYKVLITAEKLNLDLIQLHGQESGEYCRRARELSGKKIIKARRIKGEYDVKQLLSIDCDYHLFDGSGGETFDWTLLDRIKPEKPIIVAGALKDDNVCQAIRATNPWGVDFARGGESAVGIKNHHKLKLFMQAVATC